MTKFTDGRVMWPSISADGRVIVFERGFGIWSLDTESGQVTATVPAGPTPQHLAFSADGVHPHVVNEDAGTISTIDVASRATVSTTGVGGSPRFVVATPDGTTLAVSNAADGTVSLLTAA